MQISRNNMYHHSFFCGVCYITASCLWLNSLGLQQIKILNQSRISGIHKVVALNVGNVKKKKKSSSSAFCVVFQYKHSKYSQIKIHLLEMEN